MSWRKDAPRVSDQKTKGKVNECSTPERVLIKINDPFAFIFISTSREKSRVEMRVHKHYTHFLIIKGIKALPQRPLAKSSVANRFASRMCT